MTGTSSRLYDGQCGVAGDVTELVGHVTHVYPGIFRCNVAENQLRRIRYVEIHFRLSLYVHQSATMQSVQCVVIGVDVVQWLTVRITRHYVS